jgi:hypothetical protein
LVYFIGVYLMINQPLTNGMYSNKMGMVFYPNGSPRGLTQTYPASGTSTHDRATRDSFINTPKPTRSSTPAPATRQTKQTKLTDPKKSSPFVLNHLK